MAGQSMGKGSRQAASGGGQGLSDARTPGRQLSAKEELQRVREILLEPSNVFQVNPSDAYSFPPNKERLYVGVKAEKEGGYQKPATPRVHAERTWVEVYEIGIDQLKITPVTAKDIIPAGGVEEVNAFKISAPRFQHAKQNGELLELGIVRIYDSDFLKHLHIGDLEDGSYCGRLNDREKVQELNGHLYKTHK